MLIELVVSLCKPVMQKLKILGGGKLGYCKPMRGTTKRGGPNFEISVGGAKVNTIFGSNLVGGNILEETIVYFWKILHQEYIYKLYLNKTNTISTIIIHKNESKNYSYEEKNVFLRLF